MKAAYLISLLFLLVFEVTSKGQGSFEVNTDDRNQAVDLTNAAIKDISNELFDAGFIKLEESILLDSPLRDSYLRIYQI